MDERFNGTFPSVAKHVLSQEYKEERKNFESKMIKRIGNREWEEIKQSEDMGMKEILELGTTDRKQDIAKKYLNTVWKKEI